MTDFNFKICLKALFIHVKGPLKLTNLPYNKVSHKAIVGCWEQIQVPNGSFCYFLAILVQKWLKMAIWPLGLSLASCYNST